MRLLDRKQPFAMRCGPIPDRIRYLQTQDGLEYGFDEAGREVTPASVPPPPAGPDPDVLPARPIVMTGAAPPETADAPHRRGPGRPRRVDTAA